MPAPAQKPPDPASIVAFLAQESQQPVAEVSKLYEQAHAELASGAHITKFLHIFATRKVQKLLRQQAADRLAILAGERPLLAADSD